MYYNSLPQNFVDIKGNYATFVAKNGDAVVCFMGQQVAAIHCGRVDGKKKTSSFIYTGDQFVDMDADEIKLLSLYIGMAAKFACSLDKGTIAKGKNFNVKKHMKTMKQIGDVLHPERVKRKKKGKKK